MSLSICNVQKNAIIFQDARHLIICQCETMSRSTKKPKTAISHLFQVATGVLLDFEWGIPRASVNHGI